MGKKNRTFTSGWAPPGGWKGDIGEGYMPLDLYFSRGNIC